MPKIAKELKATQLNSLPIGAHAVGGVPGLVLECRGNRDTGEVKTRIWLLRARVAGKRQWIGIGPLHTFGLSEARERARTLRARILDGGNPLAEKRAAKEQAVVERINAVTFDKAAVDYIDQHRAGWKNHKHAQQWENTLKKYANPTLGDLSVAAITPVHVLEVLRPIWTTKNETATRLRERIEKVIAAADAQAGRQRLNPARWKGNIDAMLPAPSKVAKVEHHAALPYKQLPGFMQALAERDGVAASALAFTILTAARSGEVRGMTWGELNLRDKLWIIPKERMKSGREHRVPLSDQVLALLPDAGDASDLVFPAPKGGALSDAAMSAVLKRMDMEVTVHGFRSAFSDWVTEQTTHSPEAREMALAHAVSSAVEAAYRRGDMFEKRRQLMSDWATYAYSATNQ
jgi:integrase